MPIKHITTILSLISAYLNIFSKPLTTHPGLESITDFSRNRTQLIAENALLRQQLVILRRHVIRPQISKWDRLRLLFFARFTPLWSQSLHIIQPETLLRWHRDFFKIVIGYHSIYS